MAKDKQGSWRRKQTRSTDLVIYRGPINRTTQQPQQLRTCLLNRYNVTGTSAGYIESYLSTSSATSCPEWSSFAPLWREYRVLGISFEYYPWYDAGGYIGSSNALSVGWVAPYHGPAPAFQGAVTSNTDLSVLQLEGSKPFHPGKVVKCEWRMSDVEEAQYFSTSASYSAGGVYGMVPTVTASRQYGVLVARILVEFKGRV